VPCQTTDWPALNAALSPYPRSTSAIYNTVCVVCTHMTSERCMESMYVYIVKRIYKSKRKEFHAHDKSTRIVLDIRYNIKIAQTRDVTAAIFLARVVFRRPSSIFLSWSFNVYLSALAPDCRVRFFCKIHTTNGKKHVRCAHCITYTLGTLIRSNFYNTNICSKIEIQSKPVHVYCIY